MGSQAFASEINSAIFDELHHHVPELSENDWYDEVQALEDQWLFEVYQESGFEPIWVSGEGLGSKGMLLLNTLLNADLDGLAPEEYYKTSEIDELRTSEEPAKLARLDLALTDGYLRYVHDISEGRSKARLAFPELFAEAGFPGFDPVAALETVVVAGSSEGLAGYFDLLGPQHNYYKQLKDDLARYRAIELRGGWPIIDSGQTLHPGDSDPRLSQIRKLLETVGDLETENAAENYYDPHTIAAVKRFQFRHGLTPDGVIGKKTRAAMNVPVAARIEQITLNLERWRWLDRQLGDTYVLVNIAGFDLKAVKSGRLKLEMPVIVGQLHHESPIFSDKIRYTEFNPYWNLTPHIARTETLAHLRRNPNYLADKHIKLFSSWGNDAIELDPLNIDWQSVTPRAMNHYKLRQEPGTWNALGTMKFIFPNKYSVYLHDTPNHDLFSAAKRAFSHGCIRLSDPAALAVFLLDGQKGSWDRQRVGNIVESGTRTIVTLPDRIPVHLTYLTAWHDDEGTLRFSEDIYNRDKRLKKALVKSQ